MSQSAAAPWLLLSLVFIGLSGGYIWSRLRLPGGALLGSLVPVGVLYMTFPGLPTPPSIFRVSAQILIGMVIGSSVTRSSLSAVARVIRPAVLTVSAILIAALAVGSGIAFATGLPRDVALLATIPGGAGDMTAIALDLNVNAGVVAGFHVVRQLVIIVVVSGLIRRRFGRGADELEPRAD